MSLLLIDRLRIRREENALRKNPTAEEVVQEVERIEKEEKAFQLKGGKLPSDITGKHRDFYGASLGMSGRSFEKARSVIRAAKESPKHKDLLGFLNKGRIDFAYRQLKLREDEAKLKSISPPTGQYRTIVVDPAWPYDLSVGGKTSPTYATLTWEDILKLPVSSWAGTNCHLYLWTTNAYLPRCSALFERWGFHNKTVITWRKVGGHGAGSYFQNVTEHAVFGVKGRMGTRSGAQQIPTYFEAPRGRHSQKPDVFYTEIVERASHGPYLDVFARKKRDGWTVWGNLDQDSAA